MKQPSTCELKKTKLELLRTLVSESCVGMHSVTKQQAVDPV